MQNTETKSFTPIDLFKYQSLRNIIIPLMLLNFMITYLYYAPSALSGQNNSDLFKETIISGISQIISVFLAYILTFIERKKAILLLITSILVVQFLLLGTQSDKSEKYFAYYFLLRLFISALYNNFFLINFETFPTQVRSVAGNFSFVFGTCSGIIQPYVVSYAKNHGINIIWPFIIITFTAFLPLLFIKQTYNVPPPEIIEELQIPQNLKKNENTINQ